MTPEEESLCRAIANLLLASEQPDGVHREEPQQAAGLRPLLSALPEWIVTRASVMYDESATEVRAHELLGPVREAWLIVARVDADATLTQLHRTKPMCLRLNKTPTSYDERLAAAIWIAEFALATMRWEQINNEFQCHNEIAACTQYLKLVVD